MEPHVLVTYPNGETRRMAVGPSTPITKAVIEVFAPRFLQKPAVLLLSESANKIIDRDERLARSIGLTIETDKIFQMQFLWTSDLNIRCLSLSRL